MKILIFFALTLSALANPKSTLNEQLKARLSANQEWIDESITMAKENGGQLEEDIVASHRADGVASKALIEALIKSDDLKLKVAFLRYEYSWEVSEALYAIKDATNVLEKGKARLEVKGWKDKLTALKKLEASLKKGEPKK